MTEPRREAPGLFLLGLRPLPHLEGGYRAAAQKARDDLALAEALDVARFEVYEGYLDEELHQHSGLSR
jgi:hypothetical protein